MDLNIEGKELKYVNAVGTSNNRVVLLLASGEALFLNNAEIIEIANSYKKVVNESSGDCQGCQQPNTWKPGRPMGGV